MKANYEGATDLWNGDNAEIVSARILNLSAVKFLPGEHHESLGPMKSMNYGLYDGRRGMLCRGIFVFPP